MTSNKSAAREDSQQQSNLPAHSIRSENALLPVDANIQTMSSLEIAELTGKDHKNVVADIKNVLGQAGIEGAKFSAPFKMPSGQNTVVYRLLRRECDLVISGYSIPYRLAIIDRWHQLEEKQTPQITYAESLRLLADTIEQRDDAVRTKAEIGSRREATAMNTASLATRKANHLEVELDVSKEYCTLKRMQLIHHGQKFKWQILKSTAIEMGIPSKDVFDANYATVKAYHVDVWLEAYAVTITQVGEM